MKKIILPVLVLALSHFSMTLAKENAWTTKADMPTARSYLSASVVNGKIYVIGGLSNQSIALPTVEMYDPETDTWERKADMPTARMNLSTVVVDGKIYAIGGLPGTVGSAFSIVEEYDPMTDTWTQRADMPTARNGFGACVYNKQIYTIGGHRMEPAGSTAGLTTVEIYDPATDTWTQKADMPTPRTGLSASEVDGVIYAVGGVYTSPWAGLTTVEAYDISADIWTQKASMITGRSSVSTIAVDKKIYAIGGAGTNPWPGLTAVEMYDPAINTWVKKVNMPTGRLALATCLVGGKIYAVGGCASLRPFLPVFSTVEEYDTGLSVSSPDFNGDGIIDCLDMCILVDHWQSDYPPCDIAPPPFGDGIVDVQDLTALAEHLFEQVNDPTLVAHWPLDETEGMFAADSVGDNDAVVLGGTEWQPDSGQVDGALELDGVSGYGIAGAVLNPADGPFSIIAWVKGGAPGQVVVSQQATSNWLATDTEGNLMTELKCTGRSAGYLFSETVITDGQWHRIGLVWNGSKRMLCVDGIIVAEDEQDGLASSNNGLYIGCGKVMESGTYFSGLIDDVRIYNRAVRL
jgi:N-acetylneuraminic acid mutarotase